MLKGLEMPRAGGMRPGGTLAAPADYYASPGTLRWVAPVFRDLHDTLVSWDRQWRAALLRIPSDRIPNDDLRAALAQIKNSPLLLVADLAMALEVLAGGRSLSSATTGVLRFSRDRLIAAGGVAGAASATLGILALFGSPLLAFLDLGITTATLGGISVILGSVSVAYLAAGGICDALAKGQPPPRDDVELLVGLGARAAGAEPPSRQLYGAAYAAFAGSSMAVASDTPQNRFWAAFSREFFTAVAAHAQKPVLESITDRWISAGRQLNLGIPTLLPISSFRTKWRALRTLEFNTLANLWAPYMTGRAWWPALREELGGAISHAGMVGPGFQAGTGAHVQAGKPPTLPSGTPPKGGEGGGGLPLALGAALLAKFLFF